jgi:hypothetical protein
MATRLAFDATNVPRSSLKPNENFAQSVLNKGLYDNPWDTWFVALSHFRECGYLPTNLSAFSILVSQATP